MSYRVRDLQVVTLILLVVAFSNHSSFCQKRIQAGYRLGGGVLNDRLILKMKGPKEDSLSLIADTGGGPGLMIWDSEVSKYGLEAKDTVLEGQKLKYVFFSTVCRQEKFPEPNFSLQGKQAAFVFQSTKELGPISGLLGQRWFGGHVWQLDYLKKTVFVDVAKKIDANQPHVARLHFPEEQGKRMNEFPRIKIIVDGDSLQMLFDTGATVMLSDSARMLIGATSEIQGGSFMKNAIIERWKKLHPDWRVLRKGARNFDMIEVPSVEIAGHQVGPVWFTARPDKNFDEFMSRMMDKPIVGAIGGSAFKYFKITVDYPNALAKFDVAGK